MALKIKQNMQAFLILVHMKWLIDGTLLINIVAIATHFNFLCVYDILEKKKEKISLRSHGRDHNQSTQHSNQYLNLEFLVGLRSFEIV